MGRRGYKMFGGALVCPPGFFCMDTGTVLLIALVVVSIAAVVVLILKYNGLLAPVGGSMGAAKPTVVVVRSDLRSALRSASGSPPPVVMNADPRFSPLPPEQSYAVPPDLRGYATRPLAAGLGPLLPVNTQTRGIPDAFQQVGVLTAPGGTSTSGSPTRTILPLFGRTIDSNRNRWNYYTRTDGMNPVQVPVQFKRRNCDDDNGCDEISDGDSIGVPVMGQSFTANVYRFSTPRYLPV